MKYYSIAYNEHLKHGEYEVTVGIRAVRVVNNYNTKTINALTTFVNMDLFDD